MSNNNLFLLAINITRRCNLACAHCYLDAHTLKNGSENELSYKAICQLLEQVADHNTELMVVLTGGEPLMRPDLESLIKHGTQCGLSMVVGTNGVMLTAQRVQSLKLAGTLGVGISVDSLNPVQHDHFRGQAGAWEKTLVGIEACRRYELPFQVHFSVTENNANEVSNMIDFARASGARVLNIFFLVCTGRGESMSDISPVTYERVLTLLVAAQTQHQDILIRARCAPHFKRIAYEHDRHSTLTRAEGYEGGGCLAGIHYCRVTPEGDVTACPYIPESEGNIRHTPFWEIWEQSHMFNLLRQPSLTGKCGQCEYQTLCGGCRARPLAMGDNLMDSDPWCNYQPTGAAVIQPLVMPLPSAISWTTEAEQRLQRVPAFLRTMVKNRAETHAHKLGHNAVTAEHLATLAAQRFGDAGPLDMPAQVLEKPSGKSTSSTPFHNVSKNLPWSQEAHERVAAMPAFLSQGVRAVAEDVARAEGRLEVNVKLLDRLEAEDQPGRRFFWSTEAEATLAECLADKPPQVRLFVAPALETEAEGITKKRHDTAVTSQDVLQAMAIFSGGVEWSHDAEKRVANAPDFVRAGIKKAAEFNARREGLAVIRSNDLTRFRNRAMMRAVQRMKGFGMTELSFDAFNIAKRKVPRLKENSEAVKRFNTIREFVDAREHPGDLLGQELLEKMKNKLKRNDKQ
ncbi:MAG: radical SAM protein [Gammaproteobacteria bacterium]|nr:radical SAM protein [Gammaproteobacteria bacterium]